MMLNWGNYEGENALGLTAIGGLSDNFAGGRLSVGGGVGWGMQQNSFGGRAGLQWTR